MKRIFLLAGALAAIAPVAAGAASLREVIRTCGDDGRKLCKGVDYGQAMQDCLSSKKAELTPQCRALVERLDKGERVTLF